MDCAHHRLMGRFLLIRTDASSLIGSGHAMRCLALAHAWQDAGGDVCFVMAGGTAELDERLTSEGVKLTKISPRSGEDDAYQTIALAKHIKPIWITIDGYHFNSEYQKKIKKEGFKILVIDDNGMAGPFYADLILNQNIHAQPELYPDRQPSSKLLLGSSYVLLRREFLKKKPLYRTIPEIARNLLLTLGGADAGEIMERIIRDLKRLPVEHLEVSAVAGKTQRTTGIFENALSSHPFVVQLKFNVNNMPELMEWADIAITAAGSTCWELAFMGVPSITLVTAENQCGVAAGLDRAGIFKTLDWWNRLDPQTLSKEVMALILDRKLREEKSLMGKRLVDGSGTVRVLKAMTEGSR